MSYRLRFTPQVDKQIRKLDPTVSNRIRTFLSRLDLDNPRSQGAALVGDSRIWGYRVGDYRILASISDQELLILILEIGHRGQVYRKKSAN